MVSIKVFGLGSAICWNLNSGIWILESYVEGDYDAVAQCVLL